MQLRTARLCLDCEEVHDAQHCPVCASETFTFITRWVPAPDRRRSTRPATTPEADVYRQLVRGEAAPSKGARLVRQGVMGLTALGLLGWFWRKSQDAAANSGQRRPTDAEQSSVPTARSRETTGA